MLDIMVCSSLTVSQTGAGLGLSLFGLFTIKLKGELAVAKSVQDQFPKTPAPLIQECFYRAGGHPDIWPKSQAMLLSCNYAEALGRYEGPSLFFRGSTDLSDADELWYVVASCTLAHWFADPHLQDPVGKEWEAGRHRRRRPHGLCRVWQGNCSSYGQIFVLSLP